MQQRDLEWLSGFDTVWQRVMAGESCAVGGDSTGELEQLMEEVYYAWNGYRQLARCSCGWLQCRLQELCREAREVFRGLQTEYFLQTGELYHPPESEIFASCTISNLRKLWKNASEVTKKLHSVQRNDGGAQGERLQAAEELFASHQDRLRCMIGQLMQ